MTTILNKARLISNQLLFKNCSSIIVRQKTSLSLAEVGRLEDPKINTNYDPGQLFLHKVFGYRGIILFPWTAQVYDKNHQTKRTTKVVDEHGIEFNHYGKEVKGQTQTYYQVLMDFRDSAFVRTQTESVTFLSTAKNKQLLSIPFLDYVSHTDVLPYTNTDQNTPIENELFPRFFNSDSDDNSKFKPNETLLAWKEKNHHWLQLSDVYKETTNNIQVTAIPFFIGVRYSQDTTNYWWRYMIRIENLGDESVRIRERHWTIYSLSGVLESMVAAGIGGQEPLLSRTQPAFQYSSHVNIQQSASGHMSGHFICLKQNGDSFSVSIPSFPLISR